MLKGKDLQLKQDLIERTTQYVFQHGFSDISLRPLADSIGTSARMLIHHFGTKEALLNLVIEHVEEQFLALTDQLLEQGASPVEMVETLWHAFTQPKLEPFMRSIFELWGYALVHPKGFEAFLENLFEKWVARFLIAFEQAGFDSVHAATLAQLTVASTEGLLLQHLTNRQNPRTQLAFKHLVKWLKQELKTQEKA